MIATRQQKADKTTSAFTLVRSRFLQRKCACGNPTFAAGECMEYSKKNGGLQRKLAIGASNDPLEQEADRVADQVMEDATHSAISGTPPRIQRFLGQLGGQMDEAPISVDQVLASPGRPMEPLLRQDMEQRFGRDFSRVRVHSDSAGEQSAQDVNANAYTVGHHIVFGAGRFASGTQEGRRLIAHELTHVTQQSGLDGLRFVLGSGGSGLSPNALPGQVRHVNPNAARIGLQPQKAAAGPSPELQFAMILSSRKGGITDADARKALDLYKMLSAAERLKAFNSLYSSGEITQLLRALKATDAAGPYRDEVAQILRWVEEAETKNASGMTDDQMADAQAKFKQAEAEKEAQAKLAAKAPKGIAPPKPTTKDVEQARKEKVERTSIAPTTVTTWDKMPKPEKDKWDKRGDVVVKALVAHATKKHPDLKLTEGHFLVDFGGVEKRGQRVLAYGQSDGKGGKLAVFGFRFVEAAEANPAYVMSVVVHEVFGHPEYGQYGTEYHLALYDKAQAKMPGYTKPAAGTTERRSEIDAFAYQETEIYSLLRSFSYHTPIAAADAGKGLVSIDPTSTVQARLGLIKQQWEPKLAVAIVRGLYQRLLQDPRITGPAINAFRAGVKLEFSIDEKVILK